MATVEEVKKLAALARISVSEADLPTFTKEFDALLAYVSQLETLQIFERSDLPASSRLHNVFREDENPTPAGTWTSKIVGAFPQSEDNALVVKQIISHE